MKWVGRILIAVVVLALLFLVAHAARVYLLPRWAAIAFYLYVGLGLLIETFGYLTLIRNLAKAESPQDWIISSVRKARSEHSFLSNIREFCSRLATLLHEALVWPIAVVTGMAPGVREEINLPQRFLATLATQSNEHKPALFALILILVAYGLGFAGIRGRGYGKLFVLIFTLSVVLRHLRYSIETEGLATRLRRAAGSPYFIFLLIILADFVSLVLGFALLKNGHSPPDVTVADVVSTIKGLYRGQEVSNLLIGMRLSAVDIAVGIAGLLFYLALLSIVLHYKEFRRKNEDYLWLAGIHNSLGNFTTALRFLGQVKPWTPELSIAKAIAMLGVNQIDQAVDSANAVPESQRLGQPTLLFLLEMSALTPIPENVIGELLEKALDDQVPDVRLQDSAQLVGLAYPSILDRFQRTLMPRKTQYPLTYAGMLLQTNQYAATLECVKGIPRGTDLEEIMRLGLQLRASVMDPQTTPEQDEQTFRDWSDSEFPKVKKALAGLGKPLEKLLAFAQLNIILWVAENLDKTRVQEISFLVDDLRNQVKANPETELSVNAMEIRFKSLREQFRRGRP